MVPAGNRGKIRYHIIFWKKQTISREGHEGREAGKAISASFPSRSSRDIFKKISKNYSEIAPGKIINS
jgi:hypothetical protein